MSATDLATVVKFKPFTFDYSTLPPEGVAALRNQAGHIRKLVKTTTEVIIEVGRHLSIVREMQLDHGQFSDWVEAECGFTLRSAERYMRAAESAQDKNDTVSNLPPATLSLISSKRAVPEIVDAVLTGTASGNASAPRDVERMMNEIKLQKRGDCRKEQSSAAFKRRVATKQAATRAEVAA